MMRTSESDCFAVCLRSGRRARVNTTGEMQLEQLCQVSNRVDGV